MYRFKFNGFRISGLFIRKAINRKVVILLILCSICTRYAVAQNLTSWRYKEILIRSDTTRIDSLSIAPETFMAFLADSSLVDPTSYELKAATSQLIWKSEMPVDSIQIRYRVMAIDLSKPFQRRSPDIIQPESDYLLNPFTFRPQNDPTSVFGSTELNKTGSISRGIGFGNNQDLTVNSTLSLQLNGKLTDNINVLASVTDDNIPIQPEGNTAQLQEFDQVFIQLYNDQSKLTVGDFILKKPIGYFTNYFKRAQGASFMTEMPVKKGSETHFFTETSAALSKGKFARNKIQGIEGNQGPYRLRGKDGEAFIVVLAGTEKVFIDGREMIRGQENDYIINYNTAEITFTANQLINKDKRIVVEFQYSNANYVRSMIETSTGVKNEKYTAYINFYSEQDAKNQPILQDLSDTDKEILANVGDEIEKAVAPSFKQVDEYTNNQVLYSMRDSLGYDSVFVRVTDGNGPFYSVGFSDVGSGNGNYVQNGFDATGRVFLWVAPDTTNGEIFYQGSYAPVRLLIAPRKEQMLMAGGTYNFSERTSAAIEAGFSNNDLNTFSEKGNQNNYSHGIKADLNHTQPLSKSENPLSLKGNLSFESIGNNFQPIEPYRSVEFNRNWNLNPLLNLEDQNIERAKIGLEKKGKMNLEYALNRFQAGDAYRGIKNELNSTVNIRGLDVWFDGSLLETSGTEQTRFIRHKARVEKRILFTKLGFEDEQEDNKRFLPGTDSLGATSYKFYDWQVYFTNPDTSKVGYKIFYRERNDFAPSENSLDKSTHAIHYGLTLSLLENPANQFKATISNRVLEIVDPELSNQSPESTLLGRLEHNLRIFKNAIVSNIYYEIGSGLERRQEFIYIEDPTGQGPYTWIDYNENNIKELNEFELARPEDGDRYIRVFTPTDSYERAYSNQYTQSLNLSPVGLWINKKGILKVLAHFSNQTAFRIQRKTRFEDGANRFNPFLNAFADSTLISQLSSIRNTVFFNRTSSKFGVDYTYSNQFNKNPLTTGFEERKLLANILRIRYNFSSKYGIILEQEKGEQNSASNIIDGRNYSIDYLSLKQTLTYQPGTEFKISLINNYTNKANSKDLGGETAEIIDLGTDLRLSKVEAGIVFAKFNYIAINYSGAGNNSLSYQMLDGLQDGRNLTWGAGIQRNLGKNLQLSLSYNGRKSEDIKSIHTGSMEVRAYF